MSWWQLLLLVSVLGLVGGLANCLIMGELVLPRFKEGVWRPGWVGTVAVGAIAAVVVACMNGPLGRVTIGDGAIQSPTLSEIAGAIVVGLGGGNILTLLARQHADKLSRNELAEALESTLERDMTSDKETPK